DVPSARAIRCSMFMEGVDWPFSTLDSMLSEQPARSATSFNRKPRPRRRYLMRKPSAVWRSRSADLVRVEVEVISMFGRALFQWKATAAQSAPCLGYRRLFCHPTDPRSTDRTPPSGRRLVNATAFRCALGSVDRERSMLLCCQRHCTEGSSDPCGNGKALLNCRCRGARSCRDLD